MFNRPFNRVVILSLACLALAPIITVAQTAVNHCEAPAAVKTDLKKISQLNDEVLPFKVRREQQLAVLRDLVNKYPGDFFVQRRYQDIRMSGFQVDRVALLAEYRAAFDKTPNDTVAAYLYSRLAVGEKTKEAIEILDKLAQQSFPWAHIKLVEIYNYPNFKDAAKSKEHLQKWIAMCPNTLDGGLTQISRSGDKDILTGTVQRLRARLESSNDNDELVHWDTLWTMEFKLKTVPEHAQLRQQIAKDLEKIRGKTLGNKEWLESMIAGYRQVGDKTSQRWAEDELIRLLPNSSAARQLIQTRYYAEHPYPKGEATEGEKQAYQQAVATVSNEWVKRWPTDENSWAGLVRSLSGYEKTTNAELEAAYNGYATAQERSGGSYSLPPLEVGIARTYLKRGFKLESVPVMLQRRLALSRRSKKRIVRQISFHATNPSEIIWSMFGSKVGR